MITRSRLVNEEKVFVRFDRTGKTQIVRNANIQPGFSYRRVHYTHEDQRLSQNVFTQQVGFFFDKDFVINQSDLMGLGNQNNKVVLRRLYDLFRMCPKSMRPQFFPPAGYIPQRKISADPFAPPFATQIGIYPPQFYKSFFLTQDFSPEGFYQMVINEKGRFETGVVDDWIPVYEHSLEPIWGMDLDQAWKIVLLKFWAKRNGGYTRVKNIPPFAFIQSFTNSNWKYFNLQRQGTTFLARYGGRINLGKFILKTKNTNFVERAGLIPNSAGYELVNLIQTTNVNQLPVNNTLASNFQVIKTTQVGGVITPKSEIKLNPTGLRRAQSLVNQERRWVAQIRSTLVNKWSGSMSILDKQINTRYMPTQRMALQRDFMVNQTDFLNLFSNAYVASRRQNEAQYFSDYYLLNVEANNKRSIYLKFDIASDGWLDFSIKQLDDNRIMPVNQQSRLNNQLSSSGLHDDGMRYLKLRFILVKINSPNSPSTTNDPKFLPPKYDTYEIQYFHGYNRGDAKFLNVVRGTYILRIKPQTVNRPSFYVVNYASNSPINMVQYFPDKRQTSVILRQSMASLIPVMAEQYTEVDRKFEQIVWANTFQNIGYGFVGARTNRSCPYRLLIEVDPTEVRNSGYKLKNQFKTLNQPFSVVVNPGESTTVVLKKIGGVGNYVWPPRGIQIFKST